MAIFKSDKKLLTQINELPIKLEKDLQKITEINLKTIFELDFVSSEFSLQKFNKKI